MRELPPTEVIVATRESLHRVAEHVLSAALKTATGQITLLPGPSGFRTPALPDGRIVAVEGTHIAVHDDGGVRRAELTTVAAAAGVAGIAPGFPWTKHPPATPLEPDAALTVDPVAAAVLEDWLALGAEALALLAADIGEEDPGEARLYPEHFDLALTAAEVNYGVSPGDELIELPYLYVGPHEGPPDDDDFWNAPFGAFRGINDIRSAGDAVAFLLEGHDRVGRARSQKRSSG
jgi:hypothetical protein